MAITQKAAASSLKGAWFAEDGEIYITFEAGEGEKSHAESHPLRSAASEGWIRRYLHGTNSKPPNKNDVENFRDELISYAYEKNMRLTTFLRVGEYEGKIYVDLGTPQWNYVEITDSGWSIVPVAPIAFRRNSHMHALPEPISGGSLSIVSEFINFQSETDFLLFCSFLVNALHPTGAYFHLFLTGEKGSTKSSAARLLQKLIHPSSSSLKGMPKDEHNLTIEAYHNRLVMIDNENKLGKWLPNALCRLATGSGSSTRTLYTDRDQMAFKVARPAIITAHNVPTEQNDLIERSIHVRLQRPERYITEKQLERKFVQSGGLIMGAIFDTLSAVLANMQEIPEESLNLHRMSDASYFIACAAEKIGWESPQDFLDAIRENQNQAMKNSRQSANDPLIPLLVQAMKDKDVWMDTPTEILNALKALSPNAKNLPSAANSLSRQLREAQKVLSEHGIIVETGLMASGGTHRLIKLAREMSADTGSWNFVLGEALENKDL